MILIRLDNDDWSDIDNYVFLYVGTYIYVDLEDGYTDDVEEGYTAELIDMRFVFFSEDFDQRSDEIYVVGFIVVDIPSFTPNYTI